MGSCPRKLLCTAAPRLSLVCVLDEPEPVCHYCPLPQLDLVYLLWAAALLVQGQRANQPRIEPQRTIKTNHEPNQMHSSHTEPDQNQNQNHTTTEPDQNQNQNQTTTMG